MGPYRTVGKFDLFDPIVCTADGVQDRNLVAGGVDLQDQVIGVGFVNSDVRSANSGEKFNSIGPAAIAFVDDV